MKEEIIGQLLLSAQILRDLPRALVVKNVIQERFTRHELREIVEEDQKLHPRIREEFGRLGKWMEQKGYPFIEEKHYVEALFSPSERP